MKLNLLGLIEETPKYLKDQVLREGITFPRLEEVYEENGTVFVRLPGIGDISTFWFNYATEDYEVAKQWFWGYSYSITLAKSPTSKRWGIIEVWTKERVPLNQKNLLYSLNLFCTHISVHEGIHSPNGAWPVLLEESTFTE